SRGEDPDSTLIWIKLSRRLNQPASTKRSCTNVDRCQWRSLRRRLERSSTESCLRKPVLWSKSRVSRHWHHLRIIVRHIQRLQRSSPLRLIQTTKTRSRSENEPNEYICYNG